MNTSGPDLVQIHSLESGCREDSAEDDYVTQAVRRELVHTLILAGVKCIRLLNFFNPLGNTRELV